MSVAFYMDVHVPRAITLALREQGVDVLTAQEDSYSQMDDEAILNRAYQLQRVVFTQDVDFLRLAARYHREGLPFGGIVFAHQKVSAIGTYISNLVLIAKVLTYEELLNQVVFLPL